ncbi:hypothetical protein GCM10009836_24400 [Pseudonocardia ailaonensis]|uniref:Uncharacterized protein n=1 Tax=Pseudonocardia ailaonensis TaxID=367279 RepID=A0ABN2N1K0_9PSEU
MLVFTSGSSVSPGRWDDGPRRRGPSAAPDRRSGAVSDAPFTSGVTGVSVVEGGEQDVDDGAPDLVVLHWEGLDPQLVPRPVKQ